jgi:hypothetical protein
MAVLRRPRPQRPTPPLGRPGACACVGRDGRPSLTLQSKEEQTGVSSHGAGGACRFSQRRGGRRDQEALGGCSPLPRVEQSRGRGRAGASLERRRALTRGRSEGEGPGGEPHVLEDGLSSGGTEDDGDDAARAPAAGAGEDVGLERPLEEASPGNEAARRAWADGPGCRRARGSLGERRRRRRWHDAGTHPGVGGEDPEVADAGWPWGAGRARPSGGGRPPEAGRGVSLRWGRPASSGRRVVRQARPKAARATAARGRRRCTAARVRRRHSREARCRRGVRSPRRRHSGGQTSAPSGADSSSRTPRARSSARVRLATVTATPKTLRPYRSLGR